MMHRKMILAYLKQQRSVFEAVTLVLVNDIYPANFFKRRATWTQDTKSEEEAYYIGLWQETGGFEYIGGATIASPKTDEYNSICVRTY